MFLVLLNFVDKILLLINRTLTALNPIIAINSYLQFFKLFQIARGNICRYEYV
jgi:hypothetical protein